MAEVNSLEYWNHRFAADWQERQGCEQSRFFAELALRLMPDWLVDLVRRENATVCDWGCALGDGTAVLATALAPAKVTGIDFAAAAIDAARAQHPAVGFVCADLLGQGGDAVPAFDVLFSSNTLEHFESPWHVVSRLAACARRFMVHLVPFREPAAKRELEHLASFDWADVPLQPVAGWHLVHAAIVDASVLPATRWLGEQLLLVHARTGEMAGSALTLADVRLETPDLRPVGSLPDPRVERLLVEVADLQQALARSEREVADRDRLIATLRAEAAALGERLSAADARGDQLQGDLQRRSEELQQTRQDLAAAEARIREVTASLERIEQSRIWRWTAPLRRALDGRQSAV